MTAGAILCTLVAANAPVWVGAEDGVERIQIDRADLSRLDAETVAGIRAERAELIRILKLRGDHALTLDLETRHALWWHRFRLGLSMLWKMEEDGKAGTPEYKKMAAQFERLMHEVAALERQVKNQRKEATA